LKIYESFSHDFWFVQCCSGKAAQKKRKGGGARKGGGKKREGKAGRNYPFEQRYLNSDGPKIVKAKRREKESHSEKERKKEKRANSMECLRTSLASPKIIVL